MSTYEDRPIEEGTVVYFTNSYAEDFGPLPGFQNPYPDGWVVVRSDERHWTKHKVKVSYVNGNQEDHIDLGLFYANDYELGAPSI